MFEYAEKGIGRRSLSPLRMSDRVIRMIIAFEVTSPNVYQNRYRRPIWAEWQIEQSIRPGTGSEHDKDNCSGRFTS